MKRKILIAAGVVVAILVGIGGWIYSSLDDQTATSAGSVLDDFRASVGAPQPDKPGLPKQGVYEYSVTGNEKIVRGLTVERVLPPVATMLVRHRPDGYETETLYSKEHTELSQYELQADGAYVTFAVTKLTVGPTTTTRERTWTPKLLRLPILGSDVDGKVWGGDFTAGDLKLVIKNRTLPDETVDVGGTPVTAKVFESKQEISGDFTGSRTERFWYDPDSALVVRYTIDSSLKGDTDLDFKVDQTLTSLTPQV